MFSSFVSNLPKLSRFSTRKPVRTVACAVAAGSLILAGSGLAYARFHGEVIDIEFAGDLGPSGGIGGGGPMGLNRPANRSLTDPPTYAPGDDIQVHVTLTNSPETVTVYSDPAGAVSYTGTVSSTDETITVPTSVFTSAGDVTVYATTGEGHVGSTVITAAP